DAALLGDRRNNAAVEHLKELFDQLDANAGVSLGERLDAQRQRQPTNAERQQRSHADGVAAEQVFLERQDLMRLNALVSEFAEACVDAVDGLPLYEELREAASPLFNAAACRCGKAELFDASVQNALGVGEREIVAGEFQTARLAKRAIHGAIIATATA